MKTKNLTKIMLLLWSAILICLALQTDVFALWVLQDNPGTAQLRGVWTASETDVFAVGDADIADNTLLYDNGTGWKNIGSDLPEVRNLYGMWGTAADSVYVVGDAGKIFKYDGTDWTVATPTANRLRGIWGAGEGNDNNTFAVGDKGTILHYDGSSWSVMTAPANTPTLQDIWGTGRDNIYAVGGKASGDPTASYNAVIIHYNGQSWSTVWFSNTTGVRLKGIWGSSATELFAVGDGGLILQSSDGTTWSVVAGGLTTATIRDIWGISDTEIYACGDLTTILHYNGCSWSDVSDQIDNATGNIPDNLQLFGIRGIQTGAGSDIYVVGTPSGSMSTILLNVLTANQCRADCNDDGKVNTTDLGIMKTEFFRTNCAETPCRADCNDDCKVNTTDLGIMKIEFFRTNCFQ